MLSWELMPQFAGLDLSESFVLGWTIGDDLVFEVEFALTPQHPAYEIPDGEHWGCFIRGRLRFPHAYRVSGFRSSLNLRPAVDASGESDFGNIDSLALGPDGYEVVGEFGQVTLASADPVVELPLEAAVVDRSRGLADCGLQLAPPSLSLSLGRRN